MSIRKRGVRFRNPLSGIIGGPVSVLIGLGIAYFGWTLRASTLEFIDASEEASGSVVDVDTRQNNDGDTLFYPVIAFTTAAGESIQFRSSSGSSSPAYDLGDEVEVLYNPALPQDARVSSFSGLWLFPTILLAFGGLFALFGVIGFFNSLLALLGIGGLLGIGAWMLARGNKEEQAEESGG